MRRSSSLLLAVAAAVLLVCVPAIAANGDAQALQVAFEAEAVVVRGVAPGGRVVMLSVANIDRGMYIENARRDYSRTDDDRDGVVRFDVAGGVPEQSVWFAIDLATGANATERPPYSSFTARQADDRGWQRSAQGQLQRLDIGRDWVEMLWVRPGSGCWRFTNADGGPFDRDGKPDGRIATEPEQMEAIHGSASAPKHFMPGDVVFVVDPRKSQYFTLGVPR